jgi:hypothetical protein
VLNRSGLLAGAGALALSTPYWLPRAVVALRVRVFAGINGPEGVVVPNTEVDADRFAELYAHPAADGRSKGAALSDLFWYWLSPGPEVHQEHLEPGPRYEAVARTTTAILAGAGPELSAAATRCAAAVLDELGPDGAGLVRLRDLMMPVWAEFFYGLVFREPCPARARRLIVDNAEDVVNSLKNTRLRHMDRRERLTRYLLDRLAAGDVPHDLPAELATPLDRAHYLQGAFFNTAVVQMSEAMAHLLLVLAQHGDLQQRLAEHPDDDRDLGNVMNETLRMYPLFGIAHRITSGDIDLGKGARYPAGTVLCFDYPAYHATGYDDPDVFDPERWNQLSVRDAHHIPFGVAANRPCPAWRLAPLVSGRSPGRCCAGTPCTRRSRTPAPSRIAPLACWSAATTGRRRTGSRRRGRSCAPATAGRTSGAASYSSVSARRWCWTRAGRAWRASTSPRTTRRGGRFRRGAVRTGAEAAGACQAWSTTASPSGVRR